MGEAPATHSPGAGRGRRGERWTCRPTRKVAYLTQTTLSVDDAEVIIAALKRRFPQIVGPSRDDICYATQNRQEAVKELVPEADVVIVLGSQNSSNSMRLAEIARGCRQAGLPDRRRQDFHPLASRAARPSWSRPGPAPEDVVEECVDYLAAPLRRRSRAAPSARNTSASRCRASCG